MRRSLIIHKTMRGSPASFAAVLAITFAAVLALSAFLAAAPCAWAGSRSGGSDSLGARQLSTDWYFAEGTTRDGFTTYIAILNPNGSEATVTLTFMLGTGDPVVRDHLVPPESRSTIDISGDIGAGQDASTFVHSTLPVVAERPMYFTYQMAGAVYSDVDGGHDALGTVSPGTDWYFAEGTVRSSFATYLTIMNPNDADARIDLTYYPGAGDPLSVSHTAAGRGRLTVDVARDLLDGGRQDILDVSIRVAGSLPVVAERPMYFVYGDRDGGHVSPGAQAQSTTWEFAEGTTREGFTTYLCLLNPGDSPGSAAVTYMLASGEVVQKHLDLPARRRVTLDVSDDVGTGRDVTASIATSVPTVAERPMYFDYSGRWDGGHDSFGATAESPDWFFAEGTTRPGFVTYLTVLNAGREPSAVNFRYMLSTGEPVEKVHEVPAHSRFTLDVASDVGPGRDVSAQLTSEKPIVAERPVYFGAPAKGITICVDPGHSGTGGSEIDPATGLNVGDNTGADYAGGTERQANWSDSLLLKSLLEEDGYSVRLTKQAADDYVSLRARAEVGNSCALCIRMHYDPSGFTGVMRPPVNAARCPASDPGRVTVISQGVAVESDRLARAIAPCIGLIVRDDTGGTSAGNTTPPGHPTCLIGSLLSRVPVVCIENRGVTAIPEALSQAKARYIEGIVRGIDAYLGW